MRKLAFLALAGLLVLAAPLAASAAPVSQAGVKIAADKVSTVEHVRHYRSASRRGHWRYASRRGHWRWGSHRHWRVGSRGHWRWGSRGHRRWGSRHGHWRAASRGHWRAYHRRWHSRRR